MFARACQELQKFEDSKKALLLASTIEPDTPVAWMGLATLLDSQPQLGSPEEAIAIYSKLVTVFSEGPKLVGFLRKLAKAYEGSNNALAAAETLLRLHPLVKEEDKNSERDLLQEIVNLLAPLQNNLSDEWVQRLLGALKCLLNESVLGNNETNYKLYLSLVYKSGNLRETFNAAKSMHDVFRTAYPLEWVARVFVEDHLPWNDKETFISWDECSALISRLMDIYSSSLWGNLAVGLTHSSVGRKAAAASCYAKACERSTSTFSNTGGQAIIWWRLLLDARHQLKDWPAVESTASSIVTLLKEKDARWPGDGTSDSVIIEMHKLRAKALMEMGHSQHYATALEILRSFENNQRTTLCIIKCLLYLDLSEAKRELATVKDSLDSASYQYLSAQILFLEKDFDGARNVLESLVASNSVSAESLILLGQVYQQLNDNGKALTCLLKAAKLDSSQGKAFLFLGHHYRRAGDKAKACKCYQKAHNLSPNGEEEGGSLSDIYRELGEHEKNFALLSSATKSSSGGSWAWFRMGLHYLSIHEPQSAILSLQRCLQLSHNHRQGLESLGDAYLARGSYVAAQKVFERVLTIDPDALYPQCQIAKIHLCVGEPHTAVAMYKKVLDGCNNNNIRSVALLGIGFAHFVLASTYTTTNNFENTLMHCTSAIQYLDAARELQSNSVSVWKCLGDSCVLLHRLPNYLYKNGIEIPTRLIRQDVTDSSSTSNVKLSTALQLASKCYGAALQVSAGDATLWHDLGFSFYVHGRHLSQLPGASADMVASLMRRAANCLKKSLALAPQSSESWNMLGVISADKSVDNKALAQHCFVKSIQLKPTTSNWTHLGALYLLCNESFLAHEAFKQAQAIDPRFVTCWTGQALVAESVKHYDAADLFRHCCTLGIHPESCLGHGHHVTDALIKKKTVAPSVVALAADAMSFYSRECDDDAIGLNLAGLSLEKLGMKHTACDLYSSALMHLTQNASDDPSNGKLLDYIRCNFGRVLTSLGKAQEAADILSAISEPDMQSECILALACLKGSDFETGYTKYMSALHWLAQDHHHKANVLVALACLQYKFKKVQEAKTLLFESCSEGGSCVAGILALGALGLVEGDSNLITAALNELVPHKDTEDSAHHVAFLSAAKSIVSGDVKEAKNIISRALLRRPQSAQLWRQLAWLLLNTGEGSKKGGTLSCTKAATALSQSRGIASEEEASGLSQSSMDGVLRVLSHMQIGSHQSLKEAQRCILMYPGEGNYLFNDLK